MPDVAHRPAAAPEVAGVPTWDHDVQFYDDDGFLASVVGQYLAAGLRAGQTCLLIATADHRDGVVGELERWGLGPADAIDTGQLVLLDARQCLESFMVDGVLNEGRFRARVADPLERRSNPQGIRAFGEMVDLLWRDGAQDAAIRLEELWNDVGRRRKLSLLCAYRMSGFDQATHSVDFQAICRAHAHVAPTESYAFTGESHTRLREISLLQQRARALEAEVKQRESVERSLRNALDELHASQEDRAALLERERTANQAKDQFMAMLGHELRNPLAPIVMALELMRARGDDFAKTERAIIERQVGHLGRIVDDLLDVSRITRGLIELNQRPFELSDAIQRALETSTPLLEQRRHRVKISVPRQGLCVHGDEDRLVQVLTNLLVNAAKYTQPDGQVDVVAFAEAQQAVIRVRDNGRGISPELLPNLFDAFVQGERTLARSEGGLGLGLPIVKNLVTLHGGTVEVHSAGEGKGAEFTIRLPLMSTPDQDGSPSESHGRGDEGVWGRTFGS